MAGTCLTIDAHNAYKLPAKNVTRFVMLNVATIFDDHTHTASYPRFVLCCFSFPFNKSYSDNHFSTHILSVKGNS